MLNERRARNLCHCGQFSPWPLDFGVTRAARKRFPREYLLTFLLSVVAYLPLSPANAQAQTVQAQSPIEFKGHEEVVYDAKFLPDGKSLVTASFDQTLKLWDVQTQSVLRTMQGHTGIVLSVDVSPDGKLIASGSSDRSIRLWDVPNSDPVSTTKVHDNPVTAMATSKDGTLTATGDDHGRIRIWSTVVSTVGSPASPDAAAPAQTRPQREIATGRPVSRLVWRNDNKMIAAACVDGSLLIVSLGADGKNEIARVVAHDGEVTGVVFSPNNNNVFTCGADGYVRRWPAAIPPALTFDALEKSAAAVAIHPNGSLIAVAGESGGKDGGHVRILKRADGTVTQTIEGQSSAVLDIAFNRAGTQLAIIGADQILRVFDVSDGQRLLESESARSPLTAVIFSADGKDVIVGTESGDVLAHALTEPAKFRSLSKRPKAVRAVATTSDGTLIFYGGDGQQLWVRETASGKTTKELDLAVAVTAVAVSANNSTIAVGLATGAVTTHDAKDFTQTGMLAGHGSPVRRIVFNTTGTHLSSLTADGSVQLWDLKAQAIAQAFTGESGAITDFAFQNDNKSIVTSHADGKVRVEAISAQLVHRADDGRVNDISMAANGAQYVTAGADGTIKLWNASNSAPTISVTGFEGPALCVSMSPDNRQIAAGGTDKTVRTWNLGNVTAYFKLNVPAAVSRVSYSPDSTRLVAALSDNTLQCFDPTPLNPQPAEPPGRDASQVLRGHTASISDISWTSDSQTLRSASSDMTLREWTIASPNEKKTLTGHSLDVYSVVFSPDGETLASASADKTVRLWNLATGKALKTLATFPAAVYALDFSADGKQLVIAGADHSVRLYSVSDGREIRQFNGPTHPVYTVAFSPDDHQIAAAGMGLGDERSIFVWSIDSTEPTAILKGHEDDVYRTQFNSAGSRLMSIGYSGALRIWDVSSRQQVFGQNLGAVSYSGAISPDGSTVVVTSNDRTARLLTLPDSAR